MTEGESESADVETDLEPGDVVVDRDAAPEERHRAVVIRVRRGETISDVEVPRKDATVAELNPGRDPCDVPVEVAFLDDVEEWLVHRDAAGRAAPGTEPEALREAAKNGELRSYLYPAGRLEEKRR